jgi:steroid delta-isomerase-like uncharacterized protein
MGAGKDLWSELVIRYNQADWSGWVSLCTSDAVFIDGFAHCEGREEIASYLRASGNAFSDAKLDTSLMVEEGDTVVAEWTWTATHTGPLPMPDGTEVPATGKTAESTGVSVLTVRDGKLASERDYSDSAPFMRQLGLLPEA